MLAAAPGALAACGPPERAQLAPLAFAAASLIDTLQAIGAAHAATGAPAPTFNFAGSATLARQLEHGASADIFISADEAWMDHVAALGLIETATRAPLLTNRLVLIAPAGSTAQLDVAALNLGPALGDSRLAMADPDAVPAGRYGRAALQALGAWRQAEGRLARTDDVREALRLVEVGEAALGLVYASDAHAAGARVRVVAQIPESAHPPISYPAALMADQRSADAPAFFRFLWSREAEALFQQFGFARWRGS